MMEMRQYRGSYSYTSPPPTLMTEPNTDRHRFDSNHGAIPFHDYALEFQFGSTYAHNAFRLMRSNAR